jgi:hypothetical protein
VYFECRKYSEKEFRTLRSFCYLLAVDVGLGLTLDYHVRQSVRGPLRLLRNHRGKPVRRAFAACASKDPPTISNVFQKAAIAAASQFATDEKARSHLLDTRLFF